PVGLALRARRLSPPRLRRGVCAAHNYCGSANTYIALLPLTVSASGVRPTPRAAIGPPPAAMAIYWRPLIEYVTAPPTACEGSRVCHTNRPLSASSARRYRSIEPLKRSPPPVARTGE